MVEKRERRTQLFSMRMLPSVHKMLTDNASKLGVSASELIESLVIEKFGKASETPLNKDSKDVSSEEEAKRIEDLIHSLYVEAEWGNISKAQYKELSESLFKLIK
jgi:hypothetical protein